MIKNIFLPETIGNYYLFGKRILGFDIGKTQVHATQLYISGTTITLEKIFQETVEANSVSYQEKVIKAISNIKSQADKNCSIYTALSSSMVIFKSLKLPFVEREKIAMVINYEIEPLLPFSLEDAIIDFIISTESTQDNEAQVLVAAVQKSTVAQHLQYFEAAGVSVEKISIDMFDLFALYKKIPAYANRRGDIALVDLGFNTTRIAYIHDGQLRMIRTLPKGTSRHVKLLSDTLSLQPKEALDKLMRFGMGPSDNSAYQESVSSIMANFWHEIQFTLNSFSNQDTGIDAIILLGGGAEIKDIVYFVNKLTSIPCELFSLTSLFAASIVNSKVKTTIPTSCTQSLATAMPSPLINDINLRQKEFARSDYSTFLKQIVIACILYIVLLSALTIHHIMQVHDLSSALQKSETEVIEAIKKQFKVPKEEKTLDDIVDWAGKEVKRTEQMWFAFSGQARSSVLKYLSFLASIDKDGLGLEVERISIGQGNLILKASVKDYEALKKLEKDLRQSKLFSYVEPVEKTEFTMRITLAKNSEE